MLSSKKILVSVPVVALLLTCVYIGIYHIHRYYRFDIVFYLMIVGLACLIVLQTLWIERSMSQYKIKMLMFYLFMGGGLTLSAMWLHWRYIKEELAAYPVETTGVVKEIFVRRGTKSKTPFAVFIYRVNGRQWEQKIMNMDSTLVVGDTIKILCSKNDPEVFERLR